MMVCPSLSCPSLSCPFQALDSAFFWWQLLVEDLVWVLCTVGLAFPLLNAAVILFCYRFPLDRRGKSHFHALLRPCDTSETADMSADGDGGFSPGPSIRASQRGFQSSSWFTGRLEPVRGLGLGLPVASQPRERDPQGLGACPAPHCPGGTSAPRLWHAGWARVRGWMPTARQKAAAGPLEIALGSAVCSWCGFGHVSSFLFPRAHSLLFVVQLGKRGMNVKTHVFFTWKTGIISVKRAVLFVSVNEKS